MGILAVGCCSCGGGGSAGGASGTIPNCLCDPLPDLLSMSVAGDSCDGDIFNNCTIQYQKSPDWGTDLNLGDYAFISTTSFPDALAGGAEFYYLLLCNSDQFYLTRIYQTSPYGSPYKDGLLWSWQISHTDSRGTNQCSCVNGVDCNPPSLSLVAGFAYSGDPSCNVQITG